MYDVRITSTTPMLVLILLDLSWSMADELQRAISGCKTLADGAAWACNRTILEIIRQCRDAEGIKDRFYVAVLGFGNDNVRWLLSGSLAGRDIVSISELAEAPIEQDPERGVAKWVEPYACGSTPLCAAGEQALSTLESWIAAHPSAPAPLVAVISDGEATDGEPRAVFKKITQLATDDGPPIVITIALSANGDEPILYAGSRDLMPDDHARAMFDIASPLPAHMREAIELDGTAVAEGAKACVVNADIDALLSALRTGTVLASSAR